MIEHTILSCGKGDQSGADHHDQLWQGTPGRAGQRRSQLGAEPPRGDDRPAIIAGIFWQSGRWRDGAAALCDSACDSANIDINMIS